MHWISILFWTWVVGGLTFIPCVIAACLAILYYLSPPADRNELERHVEDKESIKALQEEPASILKQGWVTVRRTFDPVQGDATYASMITTGYKSFLDSRSKDPRRIRAKDEFFAVLKQTVTSNVLFLYDSDPATATTAMPVDCWAAIDVTLHETCIYPSEGVIDGELWMKKNAVKLRPRTTLPSSGDALESSTPQTESKDDDVAEPGKQLPWYIFTKTNYDKEDWYFALLSASNTTDKVADRTMFDPENMVNLLESIDLQSDFVPMRWFNAMFGRLFLGVSRTASLENYIVSRIVRKLNKVNKPSYLSEIRVREVSVGLSPPLFGKATMKEFSPDGTVSMEMAVKYKGEFRITISTVATINLGSRFKPYEVALVLAVVLKELEGTLIFKIKKAPSNRFWFAFAAMPKMVLSIEPIVSDRKVKWGMILKSIESRIREVILESVVVPHFDDIAFFNSLPYPHRGGVFGEAARKNEELATADPDPEAEEGEPVPEAMAGDPDQRVAESGLRQRTQTEYSEDDKASLKTTQTSDSNLAKDHQKRKSWFSSSKNLLSPSNDSLASTANGPIPHRVPPPFTRKGTEKESDQSDSGETATSRLTKVLQQSDAKSLSRTPTPIIPTKPETRSRSASMLSVGSSSASASLITPPATDERPELPRRASPEPLPVVEPTDSAAPLSAPSRKPSLASTMMTTSTGSEAEPLTMAATSIRSPPEPPPRKPEPSISPKSTLSTLLPPPKRSLESSSASHASSKESLGTFSSEQSSTGSSPPSLLSQWRTKAADKQALQASMNQSVSQAKDAMKRWGANWSKPKEPIHSDREQTMVKNVGQELLGRPSSIGESTLSNRTMQRSSSISLSNGLNPSPPQATTRLSMDSSSHSGSTSPPKRAIKQISAEIPPPSASYRPATMMAIPSIADKARQGGIGSEGVLDIRPLKPGDEPPPTEKRRIIPPTFSWTKSNEQVPSSGNFTPNTTHKVPPLPNVERHEAFASRPPRADKVEPDMTQSPVAERSASRKVTPSSTLESTTTGSQPVISHAGEVDPAPASSVEAEAQPEFTSSSNESPANTAESPIVPKILRKPPPSLDILDSESTELLSTSSQKPPSIVVGEEEDTLSAPATETAPRVSSDSRADTIKPTENFVVANEEDDANSKPSENIKEKDADDAAWGV